MPIYNIESSEVEQMCFLWGFESYNPTDSGERIDCLNLSFDWMNDIFYTLLYEEIVTLFCNIKTYVTPM